MTTPPPLRQRPLMPGRGRVYLRTDAYWFADYRDPDGLLMGAWASDAAEAADWIRSKAKEATK